MAFVLTSLALFFQMGLFVKCDYHDEDLALLQANGGWTVAKEWAITSDTDDYDDEDSALLQARQEGRYEWRQGEGISPAVPGEWEAGERNHVYAISAGVADYHDWNNLPLGKPIQNQTHSKVLCRREYESTFEFDYYYYDYPRGAIHRTVTCANAATSYGIRSARKRNACNPYKYEQKDGQFVSTNQACSKCDGPNLDQGCVDTCPPGTAPQPCCTHYPCSLNKDHPRYPGNSAKHPDRGLCCTQVACIGDPKEWFQEWRQASDGDEKMYTCDDVPCQESTVYTSSGYSANQVCPRCGCEPWEGGWPNGKPPTTATTTQAPTPAPPTPSPPTPATPTTTVGATTTTTAEDATVGATTTTTTTVGAMTTTTTEAATNTYHQTETGAETCPGVELTSTECESAAVTLGIPWDRVDKWSSGPFGCFTNGKKVYFNTDHNGATSNPKWKLICQATGVPAVAQCRGSCFNAKGVFSQQCGKEQCNGCCECTGDCPPTEPPVELKCDDSCYTKKGNINPSKQCSKDKCNNCCECTGCRPGCTGECQDWNLDDFEKGNEIDSEHRPEYECAEWCYSKKHTAKSWEEKCTWFACSTCPECPEEEEPLQCKGSCYNARGLLSPSKQCGKQQCKGCCECTGDCPPTEPPMELKCDDSCYTKKGTINPSKQCSKDKCNNCCECTGCRDGCTGQCQDWNLDDDEKGNEIDDEHRPEYECASWCYSKKHTAKSWDKKCTWFACSTCPECPIEEEPQCDNKQCYYKKSGKVKKDLCSTTCGGCAECGDLLPECDDGCYKGDGKMKMSRCTQRICSACPECSDEEEPSTPQCDATCYNPKNNKMKKKRCNEMKCAACSECGKEDEPKPLKCDASCFSKRSGNLKDGMCSKDKCAGCSGCYEEA